MKRSTKYPGGEVKLLTLRDQPAGDPAHTKNPEDIAAVWREQVMQAPWYDPMKECLVVFLLDTRLRLIGWNLVSLGTLNETICHAREIFRPAIVAAAATIVLAHNHPAGDPQPSDDDIRVTRNIKRAGEILKLTLMDHIIVGTERPSNPRGWTSLKELGLFH